MQLAAVIGLAGIGFATNMVAWQAADGSDRWRLLHALVGILGQ